jgi:hypothetical protein
MHYFEKRNQNSYAFVLFLDFRFFQKFSFLSVAEFTSLLKTKSIRNLPVPVGVNDNSDRKVVGVCLKPRLL